MLREQISTGLHVHRHNVHVMHQNDWCHTVLYSTVKCRNGRQRGGKSFGVEADLHRVSRHVSSYAKNVVHLASFQYESNS